MAIFVERAAHSVNNVFSLYNVYLEFWLFPILVSRVNANTSRLEINYLAFKLDYLTLKSKR